jgi:hypothetical protein
MEHFSVDTSDQQTFPWIRIRYIRRIELSSGEDGLEEKSVIVQVSRGFRSGYRDQNGASPRQSFLRVIVVITINCKGVIDKSNPNPLLLLLFTTTKCVTKSICDPITDSLSYICGVVIHHTVQMSNLILQFP